MGGFVTLFLKVYSCFVAQRKRVRPITGRSEDRNLPKQIQALAQLVERSTVVVYKHRTAAGSIPASLKQPLFLRFAEKKWYKILCIGDFVAL